MVLGRRRIMLVYGYRCAGERGLRIADGRVLVVARHVLGRHRRRAGTIEANRGLFWGIGYTEPVRRLARRLEALGENHSDDLPAMPDLVRSQRHYRGADIAAVAEQLGRLYCVARIAIGQDVQHARHGAAGAVVDVDDVAASDRAGRKEGIDGVGQRHIGGVAGLAGNLQAAVDARRGAADFGCLLHDQMLSWAASRRARTKVRLPSSGLWSLSPWVRAAAKAASAACWAPAS